MTSFIKEVAIDVGFIGGDDARPHVAGNLEVDGCEHGDKDSCDDIN